MTEEKLFKPEDITIYVPFYNTWQTIPPCIDGIIKQSVQPGRMLLIDDGSEPPFAGSKEKLEVIRAPENKGLASARNTALENCVTPLIASLDSDVVPEKDWLENLLEAMNSNQNISGAGGKLSEYYQDTLGDRWRAVHMAQHWGDKAFLNPRFIYGANNIFKTEALRSIGGYSASLRTNYEDMSLSETLYAKGHSLFYTPSAKAYHLRRDTEESILQGFWKWYHAKGLTAGEFNSGDGLIDRIERVNFGIFRYRYDMDLNAERKDFLELDSLIPWVFCALDLQLANKTANIQVPEFPSTKLFSRLPENSRGLFLKIIPETKKPSRKETWHDEYINKFNLCLHKYDWK